MKILITEQQQLLLELAWLNDTVAHIGNHRIPLIPKVYQILYGGNKRVKTFHTSDIDGINNIRNIVGTKKTISTFSYMSSDLTRSVYGIQTAGGVLYEMEGNLVLDSSFDIMSRPDENGYRWIGQYELPGNLPDKWNEMLQSPRIQNKEHLLYTKNKGEYIRDYIILAQEFILKYKDEIISRIKIDSRYSTSSWDEILVNNISVHDVMVIEESTRYRYQQRNNTNKVKIDSIDEYRNHITRKLQEFITGQVYFGKKGSDDPENFVLRRGGYTDRSIYNNNTVRHVQ